MTERPTAIDADLKIYNGVMAGRFKVPFCAFKTVAIQEAVKGQIGIERLAGQYRLEGGMVVYNPHGQIQAIVARPSVKIIRHQFGYESGFPFESY